MVPIVKQKLLTLPENLHSPPVSFVLWNSCCSIVSVLCSTLQIIVCLSVFLVIVTPSDFGRVRVAHLFSCFLAVLLCIFGYLVPCCDVRYDFRIKTEQKRCSVRLVICRKDHVLFMCVFTHSGVQHILRCVFCCVFLRLVFCILYVVSFSGLLILDCPSVFSNIYLQ